MIKPKKAEFKSMTACQRYKMMGHFGENKSVSVGDTVLELKWKSGRRVYFAFILEEKILVLLGGNKNGQDKDIRKA